MLIDKAFLNELQKGLEDKYTTIIVDAYIWNKADNKVLIQKRSATREYLPECWDLVGGHLEDNESIFDGLEREIKEEVAMQLESIYSLVDGFEWDNEASTINLAFVCSASGTPKIEKDKVSELRWIDESDFDEIKTNASDETMSTLEKAFMFIRAIKLSN